MEENPITYIPDSGEPVEVPNTMYYRRLVCEGSLLIIAAKPARTKTIKEEVPLNGQ